MNIKQTAELFHLNPNVLRFYEKKGLLTPDRNENSYRHYKEEDLCRIQLILLYRAMDFPIEDIAVMLEKGEDDLLLYAQQYELLNNRIHALTLMRETLGKSLNMLLQGSVDHDVLMANIKESAHRMKQAEGWRDEWDFDSWAAQYDEVVSSDDPTALGFYRHYEEVLDRCAFKVCEREGKVLEIGIGTGNLAKRILPYRELEGVDQSLEMLVIAKRKLPECPLYYGTFLKLPFEQHTFSTIVTSYAFHHCRQEEKQLALKEMDRVLEPHGRLIIADLMFENQKTRDAFATTCTVREREELENEYFANVDELRTAAENLGYQVQMEQIDDRIWLFTTEK